MDPKNIERVLARKYEDYDCAGLSVTNIPEILMIEESVAIMYLQTRRKIRKEGKVDEKS